MKKVVTLMLALAITIGITGCGNSEKQEALIDYINNSMAELGAIEAELLESYESVTGDNYTNDLDMLTELTTNTSVLARELQDKAVEIAEDITDAEILAVHQLYMNYSSKLMNAINLTILGIETQDMTAILEVNEMINESNNHILDYKEALYKLAEERRVTFE